MKSIRSAISLILCAVFIVGLLPITAIAAANQPAAVAVTGRLLTSQEQSSFNITDEGVYGLFFHCDSGTDAAGNYKGVSLFDIVVSYDNTKVLPYSRTSKTTQETPDSSCCRRVGVINGDDDPYSTLAFTTATSSTTTTFDYGVMATDPDSVTYLQPQNMFVFFFKPVVVNCANFNKTTFKMETDTTAMTSVSASASLEYKSKAGSTLDVTPTFTYPNSTEDELTSVEVAVSPVPATPGLPNVSVPYADATPSFNEVTFTPKYSGLDGDYIGTATTAWSIVTEGLNGITIDSSGVLTVTTAAIKNTFTDNRLSVVVKATATAGSVNKTKNVEVKIGRFASEFTKMDALSGGTTEMTVPADGAEADATSAAFTTKSFDQYGVEMSDTYTWTIKEKVGDKEVTGISIDNGIITVAKGSAAVKAAVINTTGTVFVVTATSVGKTSLSKTAEVTIKRDKSVATKMDDLSNGVTEMTVPADGAEANATSTAFTTKSFDQYGVEMSDTYKWTIKEKVGDEEVTGISIDNGIITVNRNSAAVKAAVADTTGTVFVVTATSDENDSLSKTAEVTIKRAEPVATTVEIYKGGSETPLGTTDTIILPTTNTPNTASYTAKTYDQYGTVMGETPVMSFTGAEEGKVTYSESEGTVTVTVTEDAVKGSSYTLTATSASDNTVKTTVTIYVRDIEITWPTVQVKDEPTYGDTWKDILTLSANGKAELNGTAVPGTFSVKNKDSKPGAGEKTFTIIFKSNDGVYEVESPNSEDRAVTIQKADPIKEELNFTFSNHVYNGVEQGIGTVTAASGVEGLGGITVKYGDANATDAPETTLVAKDAKTYSVWAVIDNTGDNYKAASIKLGDYTIAKADITGIETSAPAGKTVLANDAANTSIAGLKNLFKDADALPTSVTVNFGDGKTESLSMVWDDDTGDYNVKGGTYSYTGTVTLTDNFTNTKNMSLKTSVTVKPVTATLSLTPASLTKAMADVDNATTYADLGLPAVVTVDYDKDVTDTTYSITGWNKTLAQLQDIDATNGNKTETLTPTFEAPQWATLGTTPTCSLTITKKHAVSVAFTTDINDVTYGDSTATPVATASQIGTNGLGETTEIIYEYKEKGKLDSTYTTVVPTDAGEYVVRARYENDTHYGDITDEFKISQKEISLGLDSEELGNPTYNGSQINLPESAIKFNGCSAITFNGCVEDDEVFFSLSYKGKDVQYGPSTTPPTNAGTYEVTIKEIRGEDKDNYKLADQTNPPTFTIAKALAPSGITGLVELYYKSTAQGVFNIGSLTGTPTSGWNNVKFTNNATISDPSVVLSSATVTEANTSLTYEPNGTCKVGKKDVVTVTVSSANYQDAEAKITFRAIDIDIPWPDEKTPDNPLVIEDNPVYGDTNEEILSGFIAEQMAKTDVDVPGVFTVKEGTSFASVGTTTVTLVFTPNDPSIPPVEKSYTLKAVAKKPLTIRPDDYRISEGSQCPDFELLFDGIVSGEDLEVTPVAVFELYDKDGDLVDQAKRLSAGTYTIKWVNYNDAEISDGVDGYVDNYEISKQETGTLTVRAEDDEIFRIIASAGDGGYIRDSGSIYVERGDRVTFRINAKAGYQISAVYVDGINVGAVDSYTFKNIKADHEIEAVFAKLLSFDSLDTMAQLIIQPDITFTDVSGTDWFYNYVMDMARADVINGYPDGSFKPTGDVTWGEALKLVMKATGYPSYTASQGDHWATGYMLRAINFGLIQNPVDLDKPITRGELADLAAKALKLGQPEGGNPFQDEAPAAAISLYEAGIITGSLDSGKLLYRTDSTITRAEMATVVWRMYEK